MACPIRNGSLCLGLRQCCRVWECRICDTVSSASEEDLDRVGIVLFDEIDPDDCCVDDGSSASSSALSDLFEEHYQSETHRKCVEVFLLLPHSSGLRLEVASWLDPFVEALPRLEQRDEIQKILCQYAHSGSSVAFTPFLVKAVITLQAYLKAEIKVALQQQIFAALTHGDAVDSSSAFLCSESSQPIQDHSGFQGDPVNLVASLVLQFLPDVSGPPFVAPSASAFMEREFRELITGAADHGNKSEEERVREMRCLLIGKDPPIQQVISAGVVPRLVEFLNRDGDPALQREAAWTLALIATSERSTVIMEMGAIPLLVHLLSSPNDGVREEAVSALGLIASVSPHCRDVVLQADAMRPLLQQLNGHSELSMVRIVAWTLDFFCMGQPGPDFAFIRPALPTVAQLILSTDEEVLMYTCGALSALSEGPEEQIQAIIDTGVCARLVELLLSPFLHVQSRALNAVSYIVKGNDLQSQSIVNSNALPALLALLSSTKEDIRVPACLTISNITATNQVQIQAVIDSEIVPPLIQLMNNGDSGIRKVAAWAVANALRVGSDAQIHFIARNGCIPALCDLLAASDSKTVSECLQGLKKILVAGEKAGSMEMVYRIREVGGVNKIKTLLKHKCSNICSISKSLIDEFFPASTKTICMRSRCGKRQWASLSN
jgi:importin subunit alpha-6/7